MEFLRIDLFEDEIFVFTPAGDVKQLPKGATPIDFAFAVHTEVGYHCDGAKVNGRIAPLTRKLKSGDTVEIVTDPKRSPSRDWLNFVQTARARQKIRHCVRQEEDEGAKHIGKEFFDRELRKRRRKASEAELREAAQKLGYSSLDSLHTALGRGDVALSQVLKQLWPEQSLTEAPDKPSPFMRLVDQIKGGSRVKIQGISDVMVRYSQCCQPVPGDDVIGYITRGRGISIHRKDCPNILNFADHPERRIEIDWQTDRAQRFFVRFDTEGTDRRGLLSDIATAITNTGTNIQSAGITGTEGGMRGEFIVEIEDLSHLNRVMKSVRKVKGITSVERREKLADSSLRAEGD